MANLISPQAASTYPIVSPVSAGALCCAIGILPIAVNPTIGDTWRMVRLPANVTVVGGLIYSGDLDTNASEALDFDLGWEANGDEIADPDGFGNLGVLATDTVAGIKVEAGYQLPLGGVLITDGFKTFNAETIISFTVVAAAATFAAGTVSLRIDYRSKLP